MTIYKTVLTDGESIHTMDTISYKDKLWLVPSWLHKSGTQSKIPECIICLSNIPHNRVDSNIADFEIPDPVDPGLFALPIPEHLKRDYEILERPEILLPL